MKSIFLIIFLASLSFASGKNKIDFPPVQSVLYEEECASCHFGYQPSMLPKRSWEKLMGGLAEHFGDDASIDEETFKVLEEYIYSHSAEKYTNYKRVRKTLKSIGRNETPIEISQVEYIKRKHKKLVRKRDDLVTQKDVRGIFNCVACHRDAKKGIFDDDRVDIPNYGLWDDDDEDKKGKFYKKWK